MKMRPFVRLITETISKWLDDNPFRLSAALSYYTLFSLAPLLTIAVAIAGLVVDESMVREEVLSQFQSLFGQAGADSLENMLESANQPTQGTIAAVVSVVTLILASMGMFSELHDALNLIWRVPATEGAAIWGAVKSRFLSFLLLIITGFLLLVSLIVSAFLAAVDKFVLFIFPETQVIIGLVDIAVSLLVITMLFALMYKVLPDTYLPWRDVWIGAAVTGTLFTLGKWALGLYLGRSATTSIYGAASSLMVILLWVYYSGLIFYLGAEFTFVYANKYGSCASHPENVVLRS
jgi:membrane protein